MFPIFFYLINTPLCSFKVAQEKTIEEENTKFTIDSSPPWVRKVEVDNNLFSILWMRGRTFTILGLVVLLGSPLFEVVTLESLDLWPYQPWIGEGQLLIQIVKVRGDLPVSPLSYNERPYQIHH